MMSSILILVIISEFVMPLSSHQTSTLWLMLLSWQQAIPTCQKEIMQNDEEPASICTVYAHLQQVYDGRLRCGHCASHCKTWWSTDLLMHLILAHYNRIPCHFPFFHWPHINTTRTKRCRISYDTLSVPFTTKMGILLNLTSLTLIPPEPKGFGFQCILAERQNRL